MENPSRTKEKDVTVFACGPGNKKCKCECPDGPCEHKWDGWIEFEEDNGCAGATAVCSRCGMDAMTHSLWVGP